MAEAVVEQRRNRFYCHQCSVEINPTLPQYTCPRCDNGFIEEITEDFDSGPTDPLPGVRFPGVATPMPTRMNDIGEIWGRQFLSSFQHLARDAPSEDDLMPNITAEDEEEDEEEDVMQAQPQAFPPYTRIQIHQRGGGPRGHDPLQAIIGQLLTGLAGGGGAPGMQQGNHSHAPHFFFGNLMSGGGLHGNPGDYAWGPGGLDTIITQLMNQLEGSGPPAASKEQMDKLPTTQITQLQVELETTKLIYGGDSSVRGDGGGRGCEVRADATYTIPEHKACKNCWHSKENTAQCSVCMEDFSLNETVRQLPCQHCFHTDCILPWLQIHGTCPVCRKTLDGHDTSCNQEGLADVIQQQQQEQSSSATTTPSATTPSSSSSSTPSTSSSSNNRPSNNRPMDFESEYD